MSSNNWLNHVAESGCFYQSDIGPKTVPVVSSETFRSCDKFSSNTGRAVLKSVSESAIDLFRTCGYFNEELIADGEHKSFVESRLYRNNILHNLKAKAK